MPLCRGLGSERRLALLHCVLCHHAAASAPGGRFALPEALTLYRINQLDASVKGCSRVRRRAALACMLALEYDIRPADVGVGGSSPSLLKN